MKKVKKNKGNSISNKITKVIVLSVVCSTIIADVVANVSSEIIHTSSAGGGKMPSASSQIAQSATQTVSQMSSGQPNQMNNIGIWLITIAVNLVFLAIFSLIAFKFSKRIAGGISSPIRKMADAANSIAEGNLNVDISVHTKDETEALADSFNKIISSLKLLKADVSTLTSEAEQGRLDTRVDLSRHNGDYREIVNGVNEMLDTVKAPLDVAASYVKKLAEGEQQDDIENNYKGYYAVLIDNLNQVSHSVNTLVEESDKLAKAGKNGDLETRGDESKLNGVYAQIVKGVNETFDSIKAPLDVASEFIQKLADGENQDDIENTYNGYYASLIDNLNHAKQSLQILVDESIKLRDAGLNGDLAARGDTSDLKGIYAEIIEGFNKMLEAIVLPLDESGVVLEKMAKNDYTSKMSEDYKGKLGELAGSINGVRTQLIEIEKNFINIAKGDLSLLEHFKKVGRRSENDNIVPSTVAMMQAIEDLIEATNKFANAATDGNLNMRVDESKFEGGYKNVVNGLNRTMDAFVAPISEASQVLGKIAEGNLTAEMTGDYNGEYNRIKTTLNRAIGSFNQLLSDINVAADQVAAGSKQVSDASQSLSQGAAEQASSVEELTSSIAEIANQTKQNATSAAQASELSMTVRNEAAQGNEKMSQMLSSMNEINESSENISKIIKVIDDIAFQTNILALNAAVEAARAGQYGKGFAVVAEEVRNLAGKSAEAAKDTTAMIESSINKVQAGTKIANETADMLGKIAGSAQKSASLVSNISTASNEQATAIAQIDRGVTQVSAVVQTNSATAEQSAASSEELSGQAGMLMEMVGKFKLKDDDYTENVYKTKSYDKPMTGDGETKITLAGAFGKY